MRPYRIPPRKLTWIISMTSTAGLMLALEDGFSKMLGIKAWHEGKESKVLWLCGSPGTEKATLAKSVAVEFLKGLHDPPKRVKLAYYVSPALRTVGIPAKAESLEPGLAKIACDLLYTPIPSWC
ncbi:hypothetical protein B9Z19DRAFT_1118234 [Tuber borchii]|uniref:Uncharacterized protein n=1 Tax=Tuber borchii TaxID=42251 RepID=A0A2T7A8V4_TUBBO|nr:hypothetical protein B9Z19DRAFT_1118234 [Tuber borchii]